VVKVGSLNTLDDARRQINDLHNRLDVDSRWRWINFDHYDRYPVTNCTLRMVDGAGLIGLRYPLRYRMTGSYYYGVASAVGSKILNVAGYPMSGVLEGLWVGRPELVVHKDLWYQEFWGGYSEHLSWRIGNYYPTWVLPRAYIVDYAMRTEIGASGYTLRQFPAAKIRIYRAAAFKDPFSGHIDPVNPAIPPTRIAEGTATAEYYISYGDGLVQWVVTPDDGTTHASNLSTSMTFVLE
jgi:hypothetical protein